MVGGKRPRPVVLCVLQGFGESADPDRNAILQAATPRLDELRATCPSTTLRASGSAVGLADGQRGNGYVGHRTIGAGRAAAIEQPRIDEALRKRELGRNPVVAQAVRIAADRRSRIHLLGLVSQCTTHASAAHLHALIDLADFHEVPVVVHAVLDGRDMPRRSAMPLLERLEDFLIDRGVIGTVSGRMYSVDAGDDWDRVYPLFQAIVRDPVLGGVAPHADTTFDAVSLAYGQGWDDATMPPTRIGDYTGLRGDFLCDFAAAKPVWEWTGEEVGLAFHHRPDGLWAICALLTRRGLPADVASDLLMDRDKPVLAFDEHCFASLTEYDPALRLPVAFERPLVEASLGACLAEAGLSQLRLGESLAQQHVTTFFSGGVDEAMPGETRRIVPSAALLDLADPVPRVRTGAVAKAAVTEVEGGRYDVILVSFAGAAVMAKTDSLEATVGAVEEVDQAVGALSAAVRAAGGALVVTSDHGRCERVGVDPRDGSAGAQEHPVPFIVDGPLGTDVELAPGGDLADVAPTVLDLLGLEPPGVMAGRSLLRARGSESDP
ncbi:MAG: phosphoglycerate mutase (2,3-diphosphoglycerate-independent) [Deltaproteobacteria bacterium]|jgi:2,3-bisphosphoglycerate-independent phosphoglycerate mutase|nr:phosphoglycerate mutase (2,3-diphosphoglycerate-independent) [Deltaproteobacteria bacterium]MBW2532629.1 phosphoglycerate mutase (2,3-diphosphoglycerate-independent) [Deltaproteobacteria bacterium]